MFIRPIVTALVAVALLACALVVPAVAQSLAAMPTLSEVCALAADPSGALAFLDGTAKGAWTLVGAALLLAMRWLVPQAIHYLRQRFLGQVFPSIAGGILARVATGQAISVDLEVRAAVAEAETRAGDTLRKVGATPDTIRARIEGELGKLVAGAPPAVAAAIAAAGAKGAGR